MAGIALGGANVSVVVGQLHADAGRRIRFGDADRDDEDPGAVLPVSRLDDEPAALRVVDPARRGPPAPVADRDARPLREQPEVLFHLGS